MFSDSKEAIYLKLVNEYKKYIELGVYKNNDKLPSVRALGTELGINPNTVARAYKVLEDEGYIKTINKKGIYVAYQKNKDTQNENLTVFRKEVEVLKSKDISKEELFNIIKEVYND